MGRVWEPVEATGTVGGCALSEVIVGHHPFRCRIALMAALRARYMNGRSVPNLGAPRPSGHQAPALDAGVGTYCTTL